MTQRVLAILIIHIYPKHLYKHKKIIKFVYHALSYSYVQCIVLM